MGATSWNDAEDEALCRLPWRARVVYLQGIRRHMDFKTGWAGKRRVLSHQFFHELLGATERSTAPDPQVTKDGLRAIFTMLERVGLVEWLRGSAQQRGAVFRCLLADLEQSAQKQDAPKTHPRRTQTDAPESASDTKADSGGDAPKTRHEKTLEDAPPQVVRYQERKEGANAPLSELAPKSAREDVREVIAHLNALAGTAFRAESAGRPTEAAESVQARLREYDKATLLRVVDRKVAEWKDDEKMAQYLRPATLFNRKKCEQYVGQLTRPLRVDAKQANRDALDAWVNGASDNVIEGVFCEQR